VTTEARQEKAGWPVVQIFANGIVEDRAAFRALGPVNPPEETYLPVSAITGLVEALEGAEDFIERVQEWNGADEDEQAEALEEIQAALSSYKQAIDPEAASAAPEKEQTE
jgi:hypothetical protein